MSASRLSQYEKVFESWLRDNNVHHIGVDETKRKAFGNSKVKSFDFLLYPPNQNIIIVEVKGRTFKGASFANMSGLECWVTADDVEGLMNWQRVMGAEHIAVFVFVYHVQNVDVDFDGRSIYELNGNTYVFFAVKLDDYRKFMKLRSPKWKTVNLSTQRFRECAVQIQQLLY